MNEKRSVPPPPAGATITLRDVYYILFRHKWMILILSLLGVASSLGVYTLWPFPYTSEAKLFIRYVLDTRTPSDIEGPSKVKTPEDRGANIINSELETLTSHDLALQVASNLGPARILGAASHSTNMGEAAGFISSHLLTEVPKDCDVIILHFSAKNPEVLQPILTALIAAYKKKYAEIHLASGASELFLQSQTDESKGHLKDTIDALQHEKILLQIPSVDDAKKDDAELIAKTGEDAIQSEADLAQLHATIEILRARLSQNDSRVAATNATQAGVTATNAATNSSLASSSAPSPGIQAKYQSLMTILTSERASETALLSHFTTNTLLVQTAQKQRAETEAQVKALEEQNPGLVALRTTDNGKPTLPVPATVSSPLAPDPVVQLQDALAKEAGLEARIRSLTNQLALTHAHTSQVVEAEDKIMQLQSEQQVADEVYKHFLISSSQARIDDAIGPSRVSNIGDVEAPTAPGRDMKKILKTTLGVLGFFLMAALGLPFVIELFLDQSVKRPMDVQARINAPFFITIPLHNGHGRLASLKQAKPVALLSASGSKTPGPGTEGQTVPPPANGQAAPWDQQHELRPFFETLRDRLMTYFEIINLTHKPKLVAVTSCDPGAGVTTTASGLASSLSETGDGNVLLVNMNVRNGKAQHFYKGEMVCGLEDVLERTKRDPAQVRDNLYVAHELGSGDSLPRVLPKRFSHLVPLMKASDYDYIIFDMPPVSEISITPRLARFMDMVLLVIESEKTSRDSAMRVAALLAESKTNVGLVLNKNRSYLPKRLERSI